MMANIRDWQTLIVGLLALIVAVPTCVFAWRQALAIKATLQADSMLRLNERFDSTDFALKRHVGAKACLEALETRRPGADVDDILDFFEDAAFLVCVGALSKEMMWHSLHYWIRLYYQASQTYIQEIRKDEPTRWDALNRIYPAMVELERKKSGNGYEVFLTPESIRQQLTYGLTPDTPCSSK